MRFVWEYLPLPDDEWFRSINVYSTAIWLWRSGSEQYYYDRGSITFGKAHFTRHGMQVSRLQFERCACPAELTRNANLMVDEGL